MQHFVYILETTNGRYYTGYTNNLIKRFQKHKNGTASKFTRAFGAKEIVYFEIFKTKSKALKREYEIKQLKREKKSKLILGKLPL